MKKIILDVYLLLVCLIAVIFLTVNVGFGVYSLIGLVAPDLTIESYKYDYLQSNDDDRYHSRGLNEKDNKKGKLSETEITNLREVAYKTEIKLEARNNLQNFIRELIFTLLFGVVLFIHYRMYSAQKTHSYFCYACKSF